MSSYQLELPLNDHQIILNPDWVNAEYDNLFWELFWEGIYPICFNPEPIQLELPLNEPS